MPGYRPPSTEPRGKWAIAIHEKRRADKLSRTGAFELLRERLNFGPKSLWSFTALDMGMREPNEDEAAVLAEWLGGYPSDAPEPTTATETPDPLVSAIDRQTAMLRAVLEAIVTRLPSGDPLVAAAEAAVLAAGNELFDQTRDTTSPPPSPNHADHDGGPRSRRPKGDPA